MGQFVSRSAGVGLLAAPTLGESDGCSTPCSILDHLWQLHDIRDVDTHEYHPVYRAVDDDSSIAKHDETGYPCAATNRGETACTGTNVGEAMAGRMRRTQP